LLGNAATTLIITNGNVTGVDTGSEVLPIDTVVSAVPWDVLPELLSPDLAADPFFASANQLDWSPIVGIHVWYDRPVMEEDFLATLDSPLQWVFNKSRILGLPGPGQYLCVSMSGAWEHAPMTKEALRAMVLPELERVFPEAATSTLERFIVVKPKSKHGFRRAATSWTTRIPCRLSCVKWKRKQEFRQR
jgi:protoporphyrinogen oxidase